MEAFEEFEDKSGMTTVSGTVVLKKNEENLIGISIGGGSPFCPCLYIVQVRLFEWLTWRAKCVCEGNRRFLIIFLRRKWKRRLPEHPLCFLWYIYYIQQSDNWRGSVYNTGNICGYNTNHSEKMCGNDCYKTDESKIFHPDFFLILQKVILAALTGVINSKLERELFL